MLIELQFENNMHSCIISFSFLLKSAIFVCMRPVAKLTCSCATHAATAAPATESKRENPLYCSQHTLISQTQGALLRDAEVQPGIKRKFPKLDITCRCSWTKFNIPSVSVTSAGRRTAEILVNIVNSLSTSQPFYSLDEKINIKGPFWQLGS